MRRRGTAAIAVIAPVFVFLGCNESLAGPAGSLCAVRAGVEVCLDRSEYRRPDPVRVTIRNTTSEPILKDGCATKLVGKTSRDQTFEEEYQPALHCGQAAGVAEVLAAAVEIAPGATFEETLNFTSFAFQGYYRANVWLLDDTGGLQPASPAFSGTVIMVPGT